MQHKHTYGQLLASHGSHMKAAHNVIHEEAHTNVRFISCDGHQLYDFKERGVIILEVEGVRYIEMHRGPYTFWARLLQGAEIANQRAESMCRNTYSCPAAPPARVGSGHETTRSGV